MTIFALPFAFALAIGILAGALALWDHVTRCRCALCQPQGWIDNDKS